MDNRDRNISDRDVHTHDADKAGTGGRLVGEGVGGVSGIAAGAAVGSLVGPVGTVIGALAGAIGGWWAGKEVADAVGTHTDADDAEYRKHYETTSSRGTSGTSRTYDDVRPAYQLGHVAGRNPDYAGKSFDVVETDLQRGWNDDLRSKHGDWSEVRTYASDAYTRSSGAAGGAMGGAMGGTMGRMEGAASHTGDRIENAADRTGDAARRGANKVIDAVDNVKDRIDGNPASKPGPDPTDRRL